MATLTIRDPYGNTFEIDATARPYWAGREGYEILPDPDPDPDPEPAPQTPASAPAPTPAPDPMPEKTSTPKTTQRAARAAQDVKEQPGG